MQHIKLQQNGALSTSIFKEYPIRRELTFNFDKLYRYGICCYTKPKPKILNARVYNYYYKVGSHKKSIVGVVFGFLRKSMKRFPIAIPWNYRVPVTTRGAKLFFPKGVGVGEASFRHYCLFSVPPDSITGLMEASPPINPFARYFLEK